MKKLLVFGDSWPWGADLKNPESDAFPILLANKLNLECVNLSRRATSIDHAVDAFLKTNLTDSVVLFCVTGYSRSMYFNGEYVCEIHPKDKDMEWYYTRVYSDELGQLNRLKNCLLIQEICNNEGIPVYFVSNWDQIPSHKLLDPTRWSPKTLIQMIGANNYNLDGHVDWKKVGRKNMVDSSSHPDETGHKLIAEELHKWISSL